MTPMPTLTVRAAPVLSAVLLSLATLCQTAAAVPVAGGARFHATAGAGVTAPDVLVLGDINLLPGSQLTPGPAALPNGFTTMFWLNPHGTIASFANLFQLGSGAGAFGLFFVPNSTQLFLSYSGPSGPGTLTSSGSLALNQWTLVTLVASPSTSVMRLYLGNQLNALQFLPIGTASANPLYASAPAAVSANATLGDFGLWSKTLTTTQVSALYAATPPAPVPEPASAAMTLAGLALLGGLWSRGRRQPGTGRPG